MIKKLKALLKEKGISYEEITDELISIQDFLTEKELEFIWNKINKATQEDWEVEYMSNLKNFCLENEKEL
jgi:hypothetical protein